MPRQSALQELQDKFKIIFDEVQDIIAVVDSATGHILDINQAVYRILGYNKDMLIGQPFSRLFPLTNEATNPTQADDLRIHGVAFESQDFLRADGSICPMDLTIKFISWHQHMALLITLRDVTERRQAEITQQKLIAELNAFAHTVAHDLKGPTSVIIMAANGLQDLGLDISEQNRASLVDLIAKSGEKMRSIIEDLLLLAESREKEIEIRPLNMAKIVNEAQQRLNYLITTKQPQIIVPASWPSAYGYGPWVEAIWTNYISNAIKYGGEPPRVELGATVQADGMVRFWVQDNGPGLSPDKQAKLFTPFTQLGRVREGGHGVGLSIVKRIVEKLNGQVSIASKEDCGSTFSFTLPAEMI
jgi:PAS domain S-box-containing protein